MSAEAFHAWLDDLVAQNRMFDYERESLIRGREIYDLNRAVVEADFPGRVVGFAGDRIVVADSVNELLDRARTKPLYFEFVPGVGTNGPTATEERERLVH